MDGTRIAGFCDNRSSFNQIQTREGEYEGKFFV